MLKVMMSAKESGNKRGVRPEFSVSVHKDDEMSRWRVTHYCKLLNMDSHCVLWEGKKRSFLIREHNVSVVRGKCCIKMGRTVPWLWR